MSKFNWFKKSKDCNPAPTSSSILGATSKSTESINSNSRKEKQEKNNSKTKKEKNESINPNSKKEKIKIPDAAVSVIIKVRPKNI